MKQLASFIFFGACAFGLFFFAVGAYMGYQYQRQATLTAAYDADPRCCSDVGANIVNLGSMHAGSKGGTPSYYLMIRSGFGDRYDVALPDGAMYGALRRGDYVTIRVYHGKVIKVTAADGVSTVTRSDPDWALASYRRALVVLASGLAVCIGLGVGARIMLASLA